MKGLYIHIPFCEYICHYCDFVKQVPKNDDMINDYINYLIKEINLYEKHFDTIDTIYIGGGTPSMLNENQLKKLLRALTNIKPREFTIEVNPESYTKEKGLIFKKYGINRVSLGVQSFNDKILNYINRKHSKADIYNVVKHLKTIGIDNISIDLIYAIPNQTIEMLYEDLSHIKNLDIDHISAYSLILEDKTYFYHQYVKGNFKPVSNDLEGKMFEIVIEELTKQGFDHYEISNFSKNNKESMHNKLYWTLNEYIGVGLGAHGFIDGHRTYNNRSLNKYKDQFQALKVKQNKDDLLTDYLIFGMRLLKGINIDEVNKKFNIDFFAKYPDIYDKINLGLVELNNGFLRLTQKGIFLGNQVFEVFI